MYTDIKEKRERESLSLSLSLSLSVSPLESQGIAGGSGGAAEAGANKDAHQSPVIQLETSNSVPAQALRFASLWSLLASRTVHPTFAAVPSLQSRVLAALRCTS